MLQQKPTKADKIFIKNMENIKNDGCISQQARPKYKNGETAYSYYVTGVCDTYDLSKGEFPITQLRPIPIKAAIKELFWIYQDQTNSLDVLENKYNVNYWSDWEVPNTAANNGDSRSIGERYGAIVKKHQIIDKLLKQLADNPFNRRNVISLWDYDAFGSTDGLYPCAYNVMFDVRVVNNEMYLDCTLTQRSNDMLVAHHINAMQYVALQMMIACHFGWKVGKFIYFINNLHIYNNQLEQWTTLLQRGLDLVEQYDREIKNHLPKLDISSTIKDTYENRLSTEKEVNKLYQLTEPTLELACPPKTNFYDIKPDDFVIKNYNPIKPQLTFDLAI